jgi:RHS repeat-associated protein
MLADGLGSVRQELVGTEIAYVVTNDPFGGMLATQGASGTTYGYTGEQEDSGSGLLYLRARYYSHELKVFLSIDPFSGYLSRPSTQHGYLYVSNNVVNKVDPSGLCEEMGDDACWSYAEYVYTNYFVDWGWLSGLTIQQMKDYQQGRYFQRRGAPPKYIGEPDPPGVVSFGKHVGQPAGPWRNSAPDFDYFSCFMNPGSLPEPPSTFDQYFNPDPRQIPSAHAIGYSGSVEIPLLITSYEVNIAIELVWDDDEIMFFAAPGGDLSIGPGGTLDEVKNTRNGTKAIGSTFYMAQIFNTENLKTDYAGPFDVRSFTASAGHGLMIADAYTPGEGAMEPIRRPSPYSLIAGYTSGYALTYNVGRSYYYPLPPDPPYPGYRYLTPIENQEYSKYR